MGKDVKISVVTTSDGDFTNVVAVFSDPDLAHEFCSVKEKENGKRWYRYYVEEIILDEEKIVWEI